MALDVLRCYASSFDKIVYAKAEELARERQHESVVLGRPVRIEVEDVKKAAESFTSAIKQQFGNDPRYSQLVQDVEGMHECLKSRCEEQPQDKPR